MKKALVSVIAHYTVTVGTGSFTGQTSFKNSVVGEADTDEEIEALLIQAALDNKPDSLTFSQIDKNSNKATKIKGNV